MNEQSLPLSVLDTYAPPQPEKADTLLKQALAGQRDKIVVIDDDHRRGPDGAWYPRLYGLDGPEHSGRI